jgi:myo-inositol-1-phosphate synthase
LSTQDQVRIAPANGKLGILIPGIGAVSTEPVGSLTQLSTIRLGKRTDARTPRIKDFVPLATLDDLAFGGWDIYEDNAYDAAAKANVLERDLLAQVKEPLQKLQPMKAVFDPQYVKRINGPNVKQARTNMDKAEMLMQDIEDFRQANGCTRMVMIWCGSTEVFQKPGAAHATLQDFECALQKNDPGIAPSQIYAYAALKSGVPFANGAPNLTHDIPALISRPARRS